MAHHIFPKTLIIPSRCTSTSALSSYSVWDSLPSSTSAPVAHNKSYLLSVIWSLRQLAYKLHLVMEGPARHRQYKRGRIRHCPMNVQWRSLWLRTTKGVASRLPIPILVMGATVCSKADELEFHQSMAPLVVWKFRWCSHFSCVLGVDIEICPHT